MITGKQISEARKRKGLTQAALADLIDVSPEAVSKWERDAYSPSPEKEERLYHVLGISFLEDDGTLNNGCIMYLEFRSWRTTGHSATDVCLMRTTCLHSSKGR